VVLLQHNKYAIIIIHIQIKIIFIRHYQNKKLYTSIILKRISVS